MLMLVVILFVTVHIEISTATCSDMPSGLYCINLGNNTDNKIEIPLNDTKLENKDVQVIYLRNSSGQIEQEIFAKFPKAKSLDVQFSNIDSFSLETTEISSLYLMYNSKFPTLSEEFMKECCQNLSILFIVGNDGLEIEAGKKNDLQWNIVFGVKLQKLTFLLHKKRFPISYYASQLIFSQKLNCNIGAFKHLTQLTHLTISKQNITNLTKNFFEGLEKLAYLNLKENGILEIQENSFENLTDLNHLILSYNNFTIIEPQTFENLKVLEALELQGLNFTDFNISVFNNQMELKVLELPTILIKENLELNKVINAFPKLETFGFQNEDKEDEEVAEFIKKCKASGYNVKFSNISDL